MDWDGLSTWQDFDWPPDDSHGFAAATAHGAPDALYSHFSKNHLGWWRPLLTGQVLGSQLPEDSSYCRPPDLQFRCLIVFGIDPTGNEWMKAHVRVLANTADCDKDTGTSTLTSLSAVWSGLSSLFLMKGWMVYVSICQFHLKGMTHTHRLFPFCFIFWHIEVSAVLISELELQSFALLGTSVSAPWAFDTTWLL